jgi:DMSO/TMAO reductase YedYZ heme-binding membrane subunit
MNPQFWWYVARATGLVAWALATAVVLWGLFLHTRALGKTPPRPWLLDLHRHLGGLTVLFVGGHMAALVADNFVHFSASDLFVPMAASWKPGPVAWGIVAFYGLLAVELTSLAMKRIPKRIWRGVHLTSYVTFVVSTLHGITAGTDMSNPLVQWSLTVGLVALTFFGAYRMLGDKKASPAERRASLERARAQAMHEPVAAVDPSTTRPVDAAEPAAAPATAAARAEAPKPELTREQRIAAAKARAAAARAERENATSPAG